METDSPATPGATHCLAITEDGHPCHNQPLPGQDYCRVHAAHASVAQADESNMEEIPIGQAPISSPEADVQELEVEIRNHSAGPADTRAMALDLLRLVRENMARLSTEAAQQAQGLLKQGGSDYLDPDFWRGLGMVLQYQVNEIRSLIQRRTRGEYTTDAYGMDSEIVELVRPAAGFLYRSWWRVTVEGLDNVPASGAALLVSNHAGIVPWDSAMIATAILEDHASPRVVRSLHDRWLASAPLMAPALAALGQVPALPENAERLLGEGELVSIFPEGAQAAGKLFSNRYRLGAFQATPYLRAALRAGAPIIPVAVIGSEEAYPVLANLERMARLLRMPYLPITPLFPWLGPLGLLPLPSKWTILFGEPLDVSGIPADAGDDSTQVGMLSAKLRERMEALLQRGLAERSTVF